MTIDTIGMGELLGWSWLFPPYRWAFGAVAASPVEAFEFDGGRYEPVASPIRRSATSSPGGSPAWSPSGCRPPASG